MTSPAALVGLTYDGTDLQSSDLQLFIEIVRGLSEPPNVRGTDTIVPALAGRAEGNRINDVLPIELTGFVRSNPALTSYDAIIADFRANVDTVRDLFHPNRLRADLVATLEDGSTRTISARPMPGIIWNEEIPGHYARVSIPLEGYDDWEITGS